MTTRESRPARAISRRVILKYAGLHAAGLAVVALILVLSQRIIGFSPAWIFWILLGWGIKDLVLFPLVWRSYDTGQQEAYDSLAGRAAVVTQRLAPLGQVKVHGVLWRARLENGQDVLESGAAVTIIGRDGLTLVVRSESAESSAPAVDRILISR